MGPLRQVIEDSSSNDWGTEEAKHLISYDYKVLALATDSFSEGGSLGQGAFGAVYYATLNGTRVAIKKLFFREKQEKQFESEVSVLAKLKHPNVVNMLGYCCDEHNNRLLVYEFMPNNSLASHLHDSHKPVLEWTKRMQVAIGSANGITFLHNQCDQDKCIHCDIEPENILLDCNFEAKSADFGLARSMSCDQAKCIHRDIKPGNILLDCNFEPKIGDFGLARFMSCKKTHISTTPDGTSGYVAPECKRPWRRVTEKSDVFSFGIILLEFITGEKHIISENVEEIYLSKWAVEKLKYALGTGDFIKLVDVKLKENYNKEEMSRMICCAAASVYKPEKNRPTMSQIVAVLEGIMEKEEIWQHKTDEAFMDEFLKLNA